jgi:hypothetical protein
MSVVSPSPKFSYGNANLQASSKQTTAPLALFFVAVVLPISGTVAGMTLDSIRVYLILMIIPLTLRFLSKKNGPKTNTDSLLLAYSIWIIITLVYHHGVERFPYGVILAVEAFGGYLAGRVMIRSVHDYQRFIRVYLLFLALMMPFAVYELYNGKMVLTLPFKGLFEVPPKRSETRYDFYRVQVVFPHAILFGLFGSMTVASVFYIYRDRLINLIPRLSLSLVMTVMALSSAPIISAFLQIFIIGWGLVTRERWRLLAVIFCILFLLAEIFSNRGPVIIFIETFTLDPMTGWWRIHIWNAGSASVMKHPIMGIGLNLHEKPSWLTDSVDNFWLLMAMRHGLTGFVMIALAITIHIRAVIGSDITDYETKQARLGYMVTLVGIIFTLATVHVWGSLYVMIMFFIGAGSFFYTGELTASKVEQGSEDKSLSVESRALPLTRFMQGGEMHGMSSPHRSLARTSRERK